MLFSRFNSGDLQQVSSQAENPSFGQSERVCASLQRSFSSWFKTGLQQERHKQWLPQKTTHRTQKAEPRRCRSGLEGKNVSESVAGRSSSKSGHHPSSSSSSAQRASHPHSSNYSTQSVRSKTLKPQLQLKLSTCPLHHVKTQVIMSPASSELSEGVSVCGAQETTQCAPLSGLPECGDECEREEEPGEEELGEDTKSLVLEWKEEVLNINANSSDPNS